MKDITPYLKYYIGQPCKFRGAVNKEIFTGILKGSDIEYLSYGEIFEYIKPILRKLSSMTEEEANKFLFNHGFHSYNWINVKSINNWGIRYEFTYPSSRRVRESSIRFNELNANDLHYLLSKGFWLFGDDYFTEGLIIEKV